MDEIFADIINLLLFFFAINTNKRKKALLLHYAVDEVFEIHSALDGTSSENNYAGSKTALVNHFKPN